MVSLELLDRVTFRLIDEINAAADRIRAGETVDMAEVDRMIHHGGRCIASLRQHMQENHDAAPSA